MKKIPGLFSILLLLLLAATVSAATSASTSDSASSASTDAAGLVTVSSVTMDPYVFYPFEEGTITVTLTNSGTSSVGLSDPDILSENVHVMNKNSWSTTSFIGPGSNLSYSFLVKVDPPDGTYFPLFTVGAQNAGSIHYPFMIKVDATEIKAVVSETPDAFSPSAQETVNVTVINPRAGEIKNIQIIPVGEGIAVTPSTKYISSLDARSSVDVSFSVTAKEESDLTFQVIYDNGETQHTTNVVLPIKFGTDKSAAVPTVNNIALTSSGSSYDVTGDVTNTGISDANGLVVTVGSPAKGTGTYAEYAVGSLAADDSSSFEVTFTCTDLSSVPLVISWKDDDGDDYHVTRILDLRTSAGSAGISSGNSSSQVSGSSGMMPQGGPPGMGTRTGSSSLFSGSRGTGISAFYPVIAGGIILVAGIVLWTKRKWLSARLKKR